MIFVESVLRAVAFLLSLLIAFSLTPGVARGAGALSVVFINPGGPAQFWGDVSKTMRAAAEDLDIELEIIDTHRDRLAMVSAARDLALRDERPDYVIVVNELQQAPRMLAELDGTGLRVFVLLNRMDAAQRAGLPGGPRSVRLIGSIVPDNEIAGYEMARSLIDAARGADLDADGIQMLALLGDAATPAALARQAGLERALSENSGVTLVRAFPVMWDQATAQERTAQTLLRHRLDAVWSANDQIALGAQVAAREAGERIGETIFFAGLNWSQEGLEAVRDGRMTMTHGGHFFAGAWSMVMLRDIEDGRLPKDRHVRFPMSAIGPGAVEDFLATFGERDWRGIDFARFRLQNADGSYDFSSDAILSATTNAAPSANRSTLRP